MGTLTSPWNWKHLLIKALESNSHLQHSSFFCLATVDCNGRPSNRTVVFRGFVEDSDKIQINTDGRSRKVLFQIEELKHSPFAEICWYVTDSWEQFRIKGTIDIIDGSNPDPVKLQQREKSWFARSPSSRLVYLDPGLPYQDEQLLNEAILDPCAGPVDAFCLLVLDPEQVDYLNLKGNERLIFTSGQNDNGEKLWTSEKINP